MKNKNFIIIFSILSVILNIGCIDIFNSNDADYPIYPVVDTIQTVSDEGWEFNITYMQDDYDWENVNGNEIRYVLEDPYSGSTEDQDTDTLEAVRKNGSSMYNVSWSDNNNDSKLSINDMIFISKDGGDNGTAEVNWRIYLWMPKENFKMWQDYLE